ncbi:HNH endonuclease [Hassallia byssoidea VB512170]|uniref:HNH endonuclease n=1 Tax=Hassallia byssoidea VB512170 TaxID=1304833 RepID=A0A846HF39_9CYAN|nr:HNH endonuclease signature motif containing protein [Hassalia byssoidea]NEU75936.1 HNH endonuclease [Hassalia byssoidea VB512170]
MSKTYIPVALRRQVYERAKGCCEYCLIPDVATFASHEIDHIIAEKHGGRTESENLALSCTLCNKHKGSDLASVDPETEKIVPLYHPRQDLWHEHFRLSGSEFLPLSSIGRVTIRLLQLNRRDRVDERQLLLQAGIIEL